MLASSSGRSLRRAQKRELALLEVETHDWIVADLMKEIKRLNAELAGGRQPPAPRDPHKSPRLE